MKNVLYQKSLRAFDSKLDIDSAPHVFATEENNHFHVWTCDDNKGTQHRGFYWSREEAIEAAVKLAMEEPKP